MQSHGVSLSSPATPDASPDRLAASARGWHRIQLAVLGFIGFCGVMWAGGDAAGPAWVQWLSAGLAVLALALACLGVYLVGLVAYPIRGSDPGGGGATRLRVGIGLTHAALILVVVATLSAWWPGGAAADVEAGTVQAQDVTGQVWCGELVEAPAGGLRLATGDGPVTLPLDRLAEVRPVERC